VLNLVIKGLDKIDLKTRQKITESCDEACVREDGSLEIAEKIVREMKIKIKSWIEGPLRS